MEHTIWRDTPEGLYRRFEFKDFAEAFTFMGRVAELAEQQNHHPRWLNEWNVVEIWLLSHDAGGKITAKDRALATTIDSLSSPK